MEGEEKRRRWVFRLQRGMNGKEGWGRRMVKEEKRQWEENEVSEEEGRSFRNKQEGRGKLVKMKKK